MTPDPRLVQSIRQRLDNLARKSGEDIQRNLVGYALERLLYRLSISAHRGRFVLKGAMLFRVWERAPLRATGDLDLLGFGPNTEDALVAAFREICAIAPQTPDGLVFDTTRILAEPLRLATDYVGTALRFDALLGRARLRMQVDVGFGDAVTPTDVEFPTLLDMPPPRLKAYPPEAVIAEKLEAIILLGLGTSRIKDFFDIWAIAQTFDFEGVALTAAVKATFARRGTRLPDSTPPPLTATYSDDPEKQRLWRAFRGDRIDATLAPQTLGELVEAINLFIRPVLHSIENGKPLGSWDRNRRSWQEIERG